MYGGNSNAKGIVLYNTKLTGDNGVYCHYEDGEAKWTLGDYKQLLEHHQKINEPLRKPNTGLFLLVGPITLGISFAAIYSVIRFVGGLFPILGVFAGTILAFPNLFVILYSLTIRYKTKENFHQFRRNHAAEHMALNANHCRQYPESPEKFCKMSRFHRECGTVSSGTTILIGIAVGFAIAWIPAIGFWKSLLFLVVVLLLLLFNLLWNPFNPLLIFQIPVVEPPTEAEITLTREGMRILREREAAQKASNSTPPTDFLTSRNE